MFAVGMIGMMARMTTPVLNGDDPTGRVLSNDVRVAR
jgi:hypothetical protein